MTEENHNGILKYEYMLESIFKDFQMAKRVSSEAIMLCKSKRPHWSFALMTPEEKHQRVA
jgi:hypothetical protein